MTNEQSGVKKTQARAEQALRELMLSGERISQYAVEKRAGLANGTLNYNCPEYRQVRGKRRLSTVWQILKFLRE